MLLAIEASTPVSSVALYGEEGLAAEYTRCLKQTHSERLLALVHRILSDSGMTMKDIDAVAVSVGPGSFTGVRVAVSTAKGLAAKEKKPVIPVSSLLGLAQRFAASRQPVCPLFDARKGEVYSARYRFEENEAHALSEEEVLAPEKVCDMTTEPTLFVGEGARVYKPLLRERLASLAHFVSGAMNFPSAAAIGEIGLMKLHHAQVVSPDALIPNYIRRSEAEIHWKKNP